MIDKPRMSDKTVNETVRFRARNIEEACLALDLRDARAELRALALMIIRHSCAEKVFDQAKGHIPPEVEFAFDILARYDWGERVGV